MWPFQTWLIYSLPPVFSWLKCSFVFSAEKYSDMWTRQCIYPLTHSKTSWWLPWFLQLWIKWGISFLLCQCDQKPNRSQGEMSDCGPKIQSPGAMKAQRSSPTRSGSVWWGLFEPRDTGSEWQKQKQAPPSAALLSGLLPHLRDSRTFPQIASQAGD